LPVADRRRIVKERAGTLGERTRKRRKLVKRFIGALLVSAIAAACDSGTGPNLEHDLAGKKFVLVSIAGQPLPYFESDPGCERDGVYDPDALDEMIIESGSIEFVSSQRYRYALVGKYRCRPENTDVEWEEREEAITGRYDVVGDEIRFYPPNRDETEEDPDDYTVGTWDDPYLYLRFGIVLVFERQ